jgi:hypothetical protein
VAARKADRREWAELAPPPSPGVYFFAASLTPRRKGGSDIHYIGKADKLRGRIGLYVYTIIRWLKGTEWVASERSPQFPPRTSLHRGSGALQDRLGRHGVEERRAAEGGRAALLLGQLAVFVRVRQLASGLESLPPAARLDMRPGQACPRQPSRRHRPEVLTSSVLVFAREFSHLPRSRTNTRPIPSANSRLGTIGGGFAYSSRR